MQKLRLDVDVLAVLLEAPNMRLQRREILQLLSPKYAKTYRPEIFNVTLARVLTRLTKQDKITKDDLGHKQVYYFIEEAQREGAQEFVDREQAVNGFKHYWSVLKPKQKKETLEALRQLRKEYLAGGPSEEDVIARSKWIIDIKKHVDRLIPRKSFLEQVQELEKKD